MPRHAVPRALTLLAFLGAACSAAAAPSAIAWRTNVAAAQEEARKSNKVLMIDVYTDWCGWCKTLDEQTYTDGAVIAASADFVALKINPETDAAAAQLAKEHGVSGFPTILFVGPDGSLVSTIVGFKPAAPFAEHMRLVTSSRTLLPGYLAEAKAGNYGNVVSMFDMLEGLERMGEAAPIYDRLRSGSALTQEQKERYALAIAEHFLSTDEYDRTLEYLAIVEKGPKRNDNTWNAYLMHSVALYYTEGKSKAMAYIEKLIADKNLPEAWKGRYQDMKGRIGQAD